MSASRSHGVSERYDALRTALHMPPELLRLIAGYGTTRPLLLVTTKDNTTLYTFELDAMRGGGNGNSAWVVPPSPAVPMTTTSAPLNVRLGMPVVVPLVTHRLQPS